MSRTKPILAASISRAMCVRASCDPRSLKKYLAGESVSQMTLTRIEEALRTGGYGHLVRPPHSFGASVQPAVAKSAPEVPIMYTAPPAAPNTARGPRIGVERRDASQVEQPVAAVRAAVVR